METINLAGCIITDGQGRILLLHRNTPQRVQWEIPGGKVEEGEDMASAAARELQEELGVTVTDLKELGSKSFTQGDRRMEYTWFSAKITSGEPKVMEPDVHDDLRYFSLDELAQLTSELSANTLNFVDEVQAGRVTLHAGQPTS